MENNFEYGELKWACDPEKSKQSAEKFIEYMQWLNKMANKYGYFYPDRGPKQYPEKCPIDF